MTTLIDESIPIPKYYQVFQVLREKIEIGEYPVSTRIPSERSLVEIYGVSRITIVKALDLLEQEHLIERRQGLGNYVTDPNQKREEKKPIVITFVVPHGLDQFPTKIIVGAAQAATDNELFLQILPIPQNQSLSVFFHSLSLTPSDGTILFARRTELAQFIEEYHRYSDSPVVLIDRYIENFDGDYVVFDDEKAGYELTRHLVSLGYHRIGFVPGQEVTTTSVIGRLNGYKKALEQHGIPFNEDLVCVGYETTQLSPDLNFQTQSAARLAAFLQQEHPDALIAVNSLMLDTITHDLMVIKNQSLRDQLDAMHLSETVNPKQTVCDVGLAGVCDHWQNIKYEKLHAIAFQDGYDLGVIAMRLMIDRIHNPRHTYQHIILPMQMHTFSKQESTPLDHAA
ncbi:MAG: GntR family transcriptional regulator [Anaerolineae bacterium]|nr:GntR family transcriptional regulator [Anaerolineae bacterium]